MFACSGHACSEEHMFETMFVCSEIFLFKSCANGPPCSGTLRTYVRSHVRGPPCSGCNYQDNQRLLCIFRTLLLTFFNNNPFNQLIENGHVFLAQPPLFKVTKSNKSTYIKDEKMLEDFILKTEKIDKKIKKGSKEYNSFIQSQREKLAIQRFKGLGEMNPEELWETTLNPDNRTMLKVQYTKGTKDKSRDDQKMIEILMGDEVAPRKDFITNNALDVTNLDI